MNAQKWEQFSHVFCEANAREDENLELFRRRCEAWEMMKKKGYYQRKNALSSWPKIAK